MTDLQSTLNAIDAATGCQQCEGPLGDSPSPDWCSQDCQEEYFASRSVALVGYREPYDLPEHAYYREEPDLGDLMLARYLGVQWPITQASLADAWASVVVERVFNSFPAWHPIGLISSLKITTVEPEPPPCPAEGVEYDFDYPTTPALTADTPPAPVMAPVDLDVAAIQRQIGGFEAPQTVRRALRRIDPRRSR